MRAVILAGGKGTRLAPYTVTFPKPLMPLDDVPILEVVVRQLRHCGFDHVTMAVGHLAQLVQTFFGDGSKFGLAIDYSLESEPLGTAGPLRLIPGLDEDFLVMNGDLLTDIDYGAFLRAHIARGSEATVGVYQREVKIDFGVVEHDEGGRITAYREKPRHCYEVSMGVYAFSPRVLELLPEGHFDFPELVNELISRKRSIHAYPFSGIWHDIGREDDYATAIETFARNRSTFLPDE